MDRNHDGVCPPPTDKKLGLVIDLDICVGCHACVINCKEWNTGGYGAPLSDDVDPYGPEAPLGAFLNRVHTFEAKPEPRARPTIVHFPKILPALRGRALRDRLPDWRELQTRSEDGIVLVEERLVHRLRALRLGVPLRRAGDGSGREGDEEMHPLRRPDLQ